MSRNLFIVHSPLQLICATEAREQFCQDEQNYLIIIDRQASDSLAYRQLTEQIDQGWGGVSRFRETVFRGLLRGLNRFYITLRIALGIARGRGKIFIGEPRNSWYRMLGRFLGRSITALDDGAATIMYLESDLMQQQMLRSDDMRSDGMPHLFTIFHPTDMQKGVVKNNLEFLGQSRMREAHIAKSKALFVGQWSDPALGLSTDDMRSFVQQLVAALPDYQIDYVAHRHESQEHHSMLRAHGIKTVHYERPLERVLLEASERPELLISYYSTVLFTSKLLFDDMRVVGLQLPLENAEDKLRRNLTKVYGAMPAFGIEVMRLEDLSGSSH